MDTQQHMDHNLKLAGAVRTLVNSFSEGLRFSTAKPGRFYLNGTPYLNMDKGQRYMVGLGEASTAVVVELATAKSAFFQGQEAAELLDDATMLNADLIGSMVADVIH